jgi:hypothetical protein
MFARFLFVFTTLWRAASTLMAQCVCLIFEETLFAELCLLRDALSYFSHFESIIIIIWMRELREAM